MPLKESAAEAVLEIFRRITKQAKEYDAFCSALGIGTLAEAAALIERQAAENAKSNAERDKFEAAMIRESSHSATVEMQRDALRAECNALAGRAVAAEMALAALIDYAQTTFDHWDKDQLAKVGKRLMWMSGSGYRDYEPSLRYIHEIDLTAARELVDKAAKWDAVKDSYPTEAEANEDANAYWDGTPPKECTTFGQAAIKRQAEREERRKHDPDFVLPLSEYRALQTERDGLLALVQRKDEALKWVIEKTEWVEPYCGSEWAPRTFFRKSYIGRTKHGRKPRMPSRFLPPPQRKSQRWKKHCASPKAFLLSRFT